jgi:hypothetical protein
MVCGSLRGSAEDIHRLQIHEEEAEGVLAVVAGRESWMERERGAMKRMMLAGFS